jgi:hypothetical protein
MWLQITRYGGAIGVFAIGYDHFDQLTAQHYSAIPTIGTLFVLNVVAAGVVTAVLVAPMPSRHRRAARRARQCAGLSGVLLAAGSLCGLVLSETIGIFGFRESGVRPAIELAVALDIATIALLTAYLVATRAVDLAPARDASGPRGAAGPRQPSPATAPRPGSERR